ncbi:MAG: RsmB/NOP family class I SAM-dependent RNA methyltransferase [Rhodobacterales bacterium]|nr:RsmB/NOP family class I SAM-dependent RNA methyltransferase [Rhodobacterales bacterium]
MTPAARVSAAIAVLDQVIAGASAERVLTTWARQNRFAGSGDRAAIRDHVFDALRRLRSCAALGGAMSGRAVMIGLLRQQGTDPDTLFNGISHAPRPLSDDERVIPQPTDADTLLDCPAWLAPQLHMDLGADFAPVMARLQTRAPVFLRVNLSRSTIAAARAALLRDGIDTRPASLSPSALEVLSNPRRVQHSAPYTSGLVELQDVASQAISDAVPVRHAQRVLDLCAGGGGKSLALAARCPDAVYYAHDRDPGRMTDLPARAARAGARVNLISPDALAAADGFDVVVVDAPCSGSGAWRRAPQGKWLLTPAGLQKLCETQAMLLRHAASLVAPGGTLAYMTCSLLDIENAAQIGEFISDASDWRVSVQRKLTPLDGGDGFYLAVLHHCPAAAPPLVKRRTAKMES